MDTSQLAAVAGTRAVRRSFAFIDLSGFTDFVDAFDDEAALSELQCLRATVREVAPLFGVRVEKWLGDGCMIVGVDNEPVVAAVVAIQQRHLIDGHLTLRAGIATGDVLLLEGDDYVGRAVNLASRLCDAAAADQVLASLADLHLPTWIAPSETRVIAVKGFAEPVDVVGLTPVESILDAHRHPGTSTRSSADSSRSLRSERG